MRRLLLLTWCLALAGLGASAEAQTLEGFASLPADTFAPGPTSGQFIAPTNGRVPPFVDQQPVQGVSSVLRGPHGDLWIMADNGFGAKENSPDFVLRMYRVVAGLQDEARRLGRCRSEGDDHLERSAAPYQLSDRRRPGRSIRAARIPVDPAIRADAC